MYVDVFQDSTGITNLTNAVRSSSEYVDTNNVTQHTLFNYNMEHSNAGYGNNTVVILEVFNKIFMEVTLALLEQNLIIGLYMDR